MTGIIHFPTKSRRMRAVSRRALLAGAAGYAAAATFTSGASAQGSATPGASPHGAPVGAGDARERLTGILAYVPSSHLGGPDPNNWLFSWLDFRAHLEALGDPDPFSESTNLGAITGGVFVNDQLFQFATIDDVYEFFGFSSLDVHQILSTGAPPNGVTYYAGGMDTGELPTIWEAAGYEPKSGEGGDFWTIGEEGEHHVQHPIQQIAFASMNNLAILDDDIVVAAPTSALLNEVQALATSDGESAADDPEIAALIETMPEEAVNVVALPGEGLEATSITPENPGMEETNAKSESILAESDDAVGPMPESEMAFFGITTGVVAEETGSDEDARFFVHLLNGSEEDAEMTAGVVLWRLENMPSPVAGYVYAERFVPEFTPEDAVQGEIAAMSFSNPETLAGWFQLLANQDLWPFAWDGSE